MNLSQEIPMSEPVQPHRGVFPIPTPAAGDLSHPHILHLVEPCRLRATSRRREYRARLIRAGRIRQMGGEFSNLEIPPETLARSAHLFHHKPAFLDHASWFDSPSLRDLAGVILDDAHYSDDDQGIIATIRLYESAAGRVVAELFDRILDDQAAGQPTPDVGLSAVLWPTWTQNDGIWTMTGIRHVESVDFVFEPAADGRILHIALGAHAISIEGEPSMSQEELNPIPQPDPWAQSLRSLTTDALIAHSGLPAPIQAHLRAQSYNSPDDVQAAIDAHRQALASAIENQVVQVGPTPPRGASITLGRTSLEQVEAALEALFNGVRPPAEVAPLSGIRELYHLLSGDYEMHGIFQPDRITLANITSSTMANLTANVLNKAVIHEFMQYPRWWEPIVTIEDFTTLQAVRWITLGGVGELPTVAEGAAYTEMTWDDKYETASFVKKGGYLGITLEAIDKDDTRRIQRAPRALAQAAWLTLGKAISAIFTDNSGAGPTLSDGVALFHASHANLGASALSYSSYATTRIAMMKQTEVNSSERLGFLTAPRYLLVPIDLEAAALQVLAAEGEPGASDNDINPYAEGDTFMARLNSARRRVIVVPHWTDTNDWAAVADPLLYPSIGLGFRYGRTPEIFSVASPTAGLMFTNDTLPVKVRFFFAVGPTDYRGLYKHNVA